jgi:hypothetical protein
MSGLIEPLVLMCGGLAISFAIYVSMVSPRKIPRSHSVVFYLFGASLILSNNGFLGLEPWGTEAQVVGLLGFLIVEVWAVINLIDRYGIEDPITVFQGSIGGKRPPDDLKK